MKITISNHADGDKLTYPLVLLIGKIKSYTSDGEIEVWCEQQGREMSLYWPVTEGSFKAVVKLEVGQNQINLYFSESTCYSLNLNYHQVVTKYIVRPVYIICRDDESGSFQGPVMEDCSLESACQRIKLGAQLIQSLTAEKLWEHGFKRKTFSLELDAVGDPVCYTFKSKLCLADVYKMAGSELWMYFAQELMSTAYFCNKEQCKWFCFMSFTRYKPPAHMPPKTHSDILKYTKGHTALGGGGLALFGTGNLHTWASSLKELIARFTDSRKIDRTMFMDDSAYRQFHWANYATGLGASLHELGHTFDLAHTHSGIMSRGFDDLHKVFLVQRSQASSQQSGSYIRPPPLMVAIETGFRPSLVSSVVMVRNAASTTSSPVLTQKESPISPRHRASSCSMSENGSSESLTKPSSVPQARNQSSGDHVFPEMQTSGGDGVHWHRASAVLLNYHKLEAYDRNTNFTVTNVVTPVPVVFDEWPTSGFKQLLEKDRNNVPNITESYVVGYIQYRTADDGTYTANIKSIEKGKLLLESHCVKACSFCTHGKYVNFTGIVGAAMKKKLTYTFRLRIDEKVGEVFNTHCECPSGQGPHGTCKHVSCILLMLVNFKESGILSISRSCTETLQTFHAPKRKFEGSPVKGENLPVKRQCNLDDPRPNKYRNMAGYNDWVRSCVLNYCATTSQNITMRQRYGKADLQTAIVDHSYLQHPFPEYWVERAVSVTKQEAAHIEKRTRKQSLATEWYAQHSGV